MKKIEGRVRNLKVEDSKVFPFRNIERQAIGSAMLGTLASSSSLMTNAPIMLMAARGIDAKTFTCEVSGYRLIGQFTTVQFKENDPLILVISEEKEQARHLVYSVLEPKAGLLYMMYEMGRSIKNGIKSIFKLAISFFLILFSILILILIGHNFFSEEKINFFSFDFLKDLLFLVVFGLAFFLITFFGALYKSNKKAGELSEKVFSILGFKNVDEQDFYHDFIIRDGVHVSVMEYRKNLKGPDPYPEDYFDKK
ncbi:putative type VI secretion system effector [Acinetobacter haemolyticus]|uniref:putative type VI secretion system effector n=1 Tax=Acinetobacter haemolyticus TaxID=29430 RepID=UPI00037FAAF3|nr:putative type VI secretion system effector [Acinetobacter haemolyticus]